MTAPDLPIATIRKNSRESYQIAIREFKGRRSVDLRIWAENEQRELVPTPKGVSIKPDLLRDVIQALQAAERAAAAEGLIDGGAK